MFYNLHNFPRLKARKLEDKSEEKISTQNDKYIEREKKNLSKSFPHDNIIIMLQYTRQKKKKSLLIAVITVIKY